MSNGRELELLKWEVGQPYQRDRDAVLQWTDLQVRLHPYEQASDWRERVTAEILTGWTNHRALYEQILADLGAVDTEHERRKAAGLAGVSQAFANRAAKDYKAAVLPLSWEVLLKFSSEWPEWKVVTFLRMMEAVPDERSFDPLLSYMESVDAWRLQHLAGQVMEKLPRACLSKRVPGPTERHTQIATILKRLLPE